MRSSSRTDPQASWQGALTVFLAATCRAAGGVGLPHACSDFQLDLLRPPQLTFGTEFEVMGCRPRALAQVVDETVPPVVHTPMTWRMWLGVDGIPDKGKNIGRWRVAPEMAFPHDTFEVISPALNATGREEVARVAAALVAHGAATDGDAAFHVHLDHRTFTVPQLVDLLRIWDVHGELLFRMSHTNIRQRSFYARRLEPALLRRLADAPPTSRRELLAAYVETQDRRPFTGSMRRHAVRCYAVNLSYLLQGTTVELRAFQLVGRPEPEQAIAFVDLALALGLFVRDGGDVNCLLAQDFDPSCPEDVLRFLDAIGLSEARFGATRARLVENAAAAHGFEWFRKEIARLLADGAIGLAAVVGATWLPLAARRHEVARWALWGAALAAALRCGSTLLEAAGKTSYPWTYAAHDGTYLRTVFAGVWAGVAMHAVGRAP